MPSHSSAQTLVVPYGQAHSHTLHLLFLAKGSGGGWGDKQVTSLCLGDDAQRAQATPVAPAAAPPITPHPDTPPALPLSSPGR